MSASLAWASARRSKSSASERAAGAALFPRKPAREREYRLRLCERDVAHLPAKAAMPPESCPLKPGRLVIGEEEAERERFGEADLRQLGGGGERVSRVPAIKGAAETGVRVSLRGHERMFSWVRRGVRR
jgi:hypothetical protein